MTNEVLADIIFKYKRSKKDQNYQLMKEANDMLMINSLRDRIRERFLKFIHKEDGMGVVEIILITIVLISLVIIFKNQISGLVNTILGKMSNQARTV